MCVLVSKVRVRLFSQRGNYYLIRGDAVQARWTKNKKTTGAEPRRRPSRSPVIGAEAINQERATQEAQAQAARAVAQATQAAIREWRETGEGRWRLPTDSIPTTTELLLGVHQDTGKNWGEGGYRYRSISKGEGVRKEARKRQGAHGTAERALQAHLLLRGSGGCGC